MKSAPAGDSFLKVSEEVIACNDCPRLRSYCQEIAVRKKREFENDEYWGKPVPAFGDPVAKILIIGLAPAAHGANRTGRMFTGDNSGLWLYRALFKAGFSNQEKSISRDDDLKLNGVMITAINRCAPPENKPLPEEILNCRHFLSREIHLQKEVKVFLVLGQIALHGLWKTLPEEVRPTRTLPKFAHGLELNLKNGMSILCSYHPSQQNTFTKVLTEPMFDSVFARASQIAKQLSGKPSADPLKLA